MAATKDRVKKKRLKQMHLPGLEPPSIKALDDAADNYFEAMQDRVALSREESDKKDHLIGVMRENGLDRYESSGGFVVTVLSKSNVTCKRKKDAESGDEAE